MDVMQMHCSVEANSLPKKAGNVIECLLQAWSKSCANCGSARCDLSSGSNTMTTTRATFRLLCLAVLVTAAGCRSDTTSPAVPGIEPEVVNNTVLLLLFNSSRPLRRKITQLTIDCLSDAEIRGLIEGQKFLQRALLAGSEDEVAQCIDALVQLLETYRERIKKAVMAAPAAT